MSNAANHRCGSNLPNFESTLMSFTASSLIQVACSRLSTVQSITLVSFLLLQLNIERGEYSLKKEPKFQSKLTVKIRSSL